ncbi:probable E3 ubiquitin-protein ligase RHG1A isoform X2 [Actinidia eriantha]|uniref:probable E3 ubiquitin-protein ligase RHG1A isoform X2 n=1 Tax=Actinidia eriantha TaxID=165200 RepID=UPI00258795DC|nr:probable E3 ubiquitin-protein ligase RHG1A isoform X2 [Actinidia eriantha]
MSVHRTRGNHSSRNDFSGDGPPVPPDFPPHNVSGGFQNYFTGSINLSSNSPVPSRNMFEEYEERLARNVSRVVLVSPGSEGQNNNHSLPSISHPSANAQVRARLDGLITHGLEFDEDPYEEAVHEDMRLDVDDMSFELSALEEDLGDVSTGLSEEAILAGVGRHRHQSMKLGYMVEELCSICQEDYVEGEDLGKLDCSHNFHFSCIKQWLMQKNTCPLCKMIAVGI